MSHLLLCCVSRDVTRHLQLLLKKEGYNFRTSSEFEIVRTVKEVNNSFSLGVALQCTQKFVCLESLLSVN